MQIPLQITFRDMEQSDAIEKAVREKAEKLNQFADIMSCRVVVQMINKHSHKGTLYQVLIDLTAPGTEIVVSRDHGVDHSHEDVYVAIRDSFDAARRQLQDHHRGEYLRRAPHTKGRRTRNVPDPEAIREAQGNHPRVEPPCLHPHHMTKQVGLFLLVVVFRNEIGEETL